VEWLDVLYRLWPVASLLITGLAAWLLWSIRKHFVTRQEFKDTLEALQGDGQDRSERIAALENRIAHVPSQDDVHDLRLCITRLEGSMDTLGKRLDGTERLLERFESVVNRQEDYLMNHGSGR